MKKSDVLKSVKDYVVLIIGCLIYCLGWTAFLIPGGIASGGGTGLCTILFFATGIPVAYSFFVLNAILLIIGFLLLGKGFGVKTIVAIVMSSVLFDVLPYLNFVVTFDDRLITAIVGGLIEAFGIGLVLMSGGSTGGTDIVAMVINKYWPVSPGRVYLLTDLFIIASVLLVPGKDVNDMMYGYVTMVTFSFAIDWVLMGSKSSAQIYIFSTKYKEISDHIVHNMNRGVTALNSVGGYSGQEGKVLLVICRKQQLQSVVNAVKEIDPQAFVSVSSVSNVYGEGFEELKTGFKRKKD
ncbi:MAG: YitT family protein [Candidatus Cryptobacteroides sp.]